jgi:hypothetical protein
MLRLLSAVILVTAGFATTARASSSTFAPPARATFSANAAGDPVDARCGDYRCDPPEDCHTCPGDCGSCCGNYRCEPPEDCRSCPQDCGACH